MKNAIAALGLAAVVALMPGALAAQEVDAELQAEAQPAVTTTTPTGMEAAAKPCELHVWPTENYLGIKMGLLSGFGAVGALADQARTKGSVATIKDLMRDYLGPDVQMAELERLDYVGKLGLETGRYEIIVHEPTPWNEDLKKNPTLKEEVKALNQKIKAGQRITDSTAPCYAELITTHIFYHKAMMYGSNLFTGWNWRQFDGAKLVSEGKGQVKNPLENFPPKDETMVEAAQIELRDAYAKDFDEWVVKKSGA